MLEEERLKRGGKTALCKDDNTEVPVCCRKDPEVTMSFAVRHHEVCGSAAKTMALEEWEFVDALWDSVCKSEEHW